MQKLLLNNYLEQKYFSVIKYISVLNGTLPSCNKLVSTGKIHALKCLFEYKSMKFSVAGH